MFCSFCRFSDPSSARFFGHAVIRFILLEVKNMAICTCIVMKCIHLVATCFMCLCFGFGWCCVEGTMVMLIDFWGFGAPCEAFSLPVSG